MHTVAPARAHAPVAHRSPNLRLIALVAALSAVAVAAALAGPDLTTDGAAAMPGMTMTHYMELLGIAQPRNLLLFMAVPVILAETLAISELAILYGRAPSWVRTASRVAGLVAGPLMLGILVHLVVRAVIPLSLGNGWRGPADVIAVGFYLLGAVPLIGITLVELGILGADDPGARRLHAIFVGSFLVVAHVAMIFGMLDPTVLGWSDAPAGTHLMPGGHVMPDAQMPATPEG